MIEYESVTKTYDTGNKSFTAVNDVSFSVKKGQLVVFLGPSGCGKTTLLRLTNRLEQLSRGVIRINGEDISELEPVKLRQSMGYVIQDIGLFPNKTIAQNIAVVPKLLRWKKNRISQRVDEVLEMVKLDPEIYRSRYPSELSGGQQQRIGVIRALAADPEILLMDEPFGAIDPINREHIQDEFLRLQKKLKKTILFVSHDIHEAIKMADKIAVFNEGGIIQYDTPKILLTQPKNKFVADFVGADRALKVLGLLRVKDAMNTSPRNLIQASTPSGDALRFLEEKGLSYGIVIDQDKLKGYVTKQSLKFEEGKVGDLVEAFSAMADPHQTLRESLSSMLMYDMAVQCITDENDNLQGTISYGNIQKRIVESYSEEAD